MSGDDLPPADKEPEERSFGQQLGATFGAVVWIALFLVAGGGIGLMLASWLR